MNERSATGAGGLADIRRESRGEVAQTTRTRRAVATWLRLARFVAEQHAALATRLRGSRLSLAQFDIIAQIGACEGLSQKELANRLVVTQGNVTQLLQKLEKRRLVSRPPSGRCNKVRLTAVGQRVRDAMVPGQERAIAGVFAGLSDAELDGLSRVLRKLRRATPVEQTEKGRKALEGGFR